MYICICTCRYTCFCYIGYITPYCSIFRCTWRFQPPKPSALSWPKLGNRGTWGVLWASTDATRSQARRAGREQRPKALSKTVKCPTVIYRYWWLVGGLEHEFYVSIQLGMSSSRLTNSYFSGDWNHQPDENNGISIHRICGLIFIKGLNRQWTGYTNQQLTVCYGKIWMILSEWGIEYLLTPALHYSWCWKQYINVYIYIHIYIYVTTMI